MQIEKNASIAVIANRTWANLHGGKDVSASASKSAAEIRRVDESHILFGAVLDADDARGVWIELTSDKPKPDSALEHISLLIPRSQVLTIV